MAQKTELQPYGLPGQIKSFVAKTETEPLKGGFGGSQTTALQAYGLPGQVQSFIAKAESAGFVHSQAVIIG